MTDDTLNFLHSLVAELLGLSGNKVIWVRQNNPRLAKPFATLQLFGLNHEASEDVLPNGDGKYLVIVP